MQSIFKDERRRDGVFPSRPKGVWPKSALAALRALESAVHFLRTRALRGQIWTQTVIHNQLVHAAYASTPGKKA